MRRRLGIQSPSAEPLGVRTSRVEALQDGIYAVTMTLLVLDLKLPEPVPAGDVQAQIIAVLPKLLVYVTVFAFAICGWLYCFTYQELIVRHDVVSSTFMLVAAGSVALLPFSSSVFAAHPGVTSAAVLLSLNIGLIALLYAFAVEYCNRRLVPAVVDRSFLRQFAAICWVYPIANLVVVPLVFRFWPTIAVPCFLVETLVVFAVIAKLHPAMAQAARLVRAESGGEAA